MRLKFEIEIPAQEVDLFDLMDDFLTEEDIEEYLNDRCLSVSKEVCKDCDDDCEPEFIGADLSIDEGVRWDSMNYKTLANMMFHGEFDLDKFKRIAGIE